MILFHIFYDLINIFDYNFTWINPEYFYLWQQSIAWTFILVSGYSYNLTKKYFKQAIILVVSSSLITIATKFFSPDNTIWFGIIHFLATSFIILWLTEKFWDKINPLIGIVLFFILFIATKNIYNGFISLGSFSYTIPESFYNSRYMFWLGFPNDIFSSGDYYPILPWIFLYMTGFYIGRWFKKRKKQLPHFPKNNNFLTFIGQHSLIIYLLHQPIIIGLITFIKYI